MRGGGCIGTKKREEGGGVGRHNPLLLHFYQATDTQAEWQGPGIEGLPPPITGATATPAEVREGECDINGE